MHTIMVKAAPRLATILWLYRGQLDGPDGVLNESTCCAYRWLGSCVLSSSSVDWYGCIHHHIISKTHVGNANGIRVGHCDYSLRRAVYGLSECMWCASRGWIKSRSSSRSGVDELGETDDAGVAGLINSILVAARKSS